MNAFQAVLMAGAAMGLVACSQGAGQNAETALAPTTDYVCGETAVQVGLVGDAAVLRVGEAEYALAPVETASGARFATEGTEAETSFWSKGEGGLLVIEGTEFPECVKAGGEAVAAPAAEPETAPWTARGNEPGWMLTVEGQALTLVHSYGEGTYENADFAVETTDTGRVYRTGDGALTATVTDAPCADDMTGMPYPSGVTVQYTDMILRGCGGEPQELLAGADWQVETIQGERMVEGSSATLVFDTAAGRVSGTTGCNSYGAEYKLSGEGITFSPPVATEMACAEPLMTQERAFLEALTGTAMFSVDESGALDLDGHNGERITARR